MTRLPSSDDERARAITRLADGTVPAGERAELQAWAARRPEVLAAIERERHVARALASEGPAAPDHLVSAIEARVQSAGAPRRSQRPWRARSRGWGAAAGLSAAVAAVAVATVIAVDRGGTPAARPSVTAAAQLDFSPATRGAPTATTARLLDVSYAGITYPNYGARFGANPTGARLDHIGGRAALTVFYRLSGGTRMSYTVFSGPPVPRPGAARMVVFDGVPLHVYSTRSGLTVVTLVRDRRTCVLAARTPHDVVLAMAAWPLLAQAS